MRRTAGRLLFWAALAVLAFAFAARRPLADPDEGRYAEAARGMVERGDGLVPYIDGRPHLTKPLGTYLASAAGQLIFGRGEFGARFAVGLAFLAWAWAAHALGTRLGGPGAGRWAAVVLATSLLPFIGGSLLTADPFLAACAGAGIACFAGALVDPGGRTKLIRLGWAALGLGFFFKGPPALLPLAGLAVAWPRRVAPVRGERWADAAALGFFAVTGFWWYAWLLVARPDDLTRMIHTELYVRLFTQELKRSGPLLMPLAVLLAGSLPWGLVLLPRARALRDAWREPVRRLLLGWVLAGLAAFTLSRGRMPLYVLPIALGLAAPAGAIVARAAARSRTRFWLAVLLAVAMGGGLVAARALVREHPRYRHSHGLAELVRERVRDPHEPIVVFDQRQRPGLAFRLDRDLLLLTPVEVKQGALAALAASVPGGVLVTSPRGRLSRLPPGLTAEGIETDGHSGFDVARVMPAGTP